jgi:RNA polymerase sigma factor (sigma-70 family)
MCLLSYLDTKSKPMDTAPNERGGSCPEAETWQQLLDRGRDGNAEACALLVHRYGAHVLRVVRRYMNQQLRKVYDSIDLTQDVWAAFFATVLPNQDFQTPDALVQFLSGVARHKSIQLYIHQIETQKRSLTREVSESHRDAIASQPDLKAMPSKGVDDADEVEHLMRGFCEREHSAVIGLVDGDTLEETALRFGVTVKTIRRILERCRKGNPTVVTGHEVSPECPR